jgi:hypothetical protein
VLALLTSLMVAQGLVPVTSRWLETAPCAPKAPAGHVVRYAFVRSLPEARWTPQPKPTAGTCEAELIPITAKQAGASFSAGDRLYAVTASGQTVQTTVLTFHVVGGFGDGCSHQWVFVAAVSVPSALGDVVALLPSPPTSGPPPGELPAEVTAAARRLWAASHGARTKRQPRIAYARIPHEAGKVLLVYEGPQGRTGEGGYARSVRHLVILSQEGQVLVHRRFEHYFGVARVLGIAPVGPDGALRAVFVGRATTASYGPGGEVINTAPFYCD